MQIEIREEWVIVACAVLAVLVLWRLFRKAIRIGKYIPVEATVTEVTRDIPDSCDVVVAEYNHNGRVVRYELVGPGRERVDWAERTGRVPLWIDPDHPHDYELG